MNKDNKILITIIFFAIVLIGFAILFHNRKIANYELDQGAASRDKELAGDGCVIIDPQTTALAGSLSTLDPDSDLVLAAINVERRKAGLPDLQKNMDLVVAAVIRAQEQEQLFSHTRPDGSEWWTVNSAVCYGENLSKGYNAKEVTNAWMNSPTHKEVIMTNYNTCGVGIYTSPSGIIYMAAEFGY